jgi:hypothetical protein
VFHVGEACGEAVDDRDEILSVEARIAGKALARTPRRTMRSATWRHFAHLDCFQVSSALANVFEDLAVQRGTNE